MPVYALPKLDVAHSLDTFRYAAAMKGLPSVNAAPVELNLNPLKWIQVELSHWFETQSKNRVSLKTLVLDDLKPASPTDFVMPAWKHIYDIDECLFVKRCSALSADEARQLRFAYKSLFLKKRASTKSTLVTHEYAIETLLALEMPRRKPVQGAKSRAELALEKLSAKGKAARASAKPSR